MNGRSIDYMLEREATANTPKHWVRAVTACNSRCIFCLDSDTPRGLFLDPAEVKAEIERGRRLGAKKLIISGGEASLHPAFIELIRHAKQQGYERVQTVTNGFRFREREFFESCVAAGLGEITFSLHGHTPELHDRLTATEGAFAALLKGMIRSVRDGRVIVNVDVVINRQNIGVLDKIVELCLSLGVREFDLLHVIPQASAFVNREQLFYDVRDHLPMLTRVFRLTRHPGVTVWTNRFPVEYLEGLEDLIQDPHKMLDEVNGRRFQARRYLDLGEPLDCRLPERCQHCFIEPFCTTMDRVVANQNAERWQVYWVGRDSYDGPLPFGCSHLGVEVDVPEELNRWSLPPGTGLYVRCSRPGPLPDSLSQGDRSVRWSCSTPAQLEDWLDALPSNFELEIVLNRDTAAWLLQQRERLAAVKERVVIVQPTHEHLRDAHERDVRAPGEFLQQLAVPELRVEGLPPCLAPHALLAEPLRRLDRALFDTDTGRVDLQRLARYHVREGYRAKSTRCRDCQFTERCDGLHINMIRDQGLALLAPLTGEAAQAHERTLLALYPEPPRRVAAGRAPEPPAPSLPGYAPPEGAAPDPLGLIAANRLLRKRGQREVREP